MCDISGPECEQKKTLAMKPIIMLLSLYIYVEGVNGGLFKKRLRICSCDGCKKRCPALFYTVNYMPYFSYVL